MHGKSSAVVVVMMREAGRGWMWLVVTLVACCHAPSPLAGMPTCHDVISWHVMSCHVMS